MVHDVITPPALWLVAVNPDSSERCTVGCCFCSCWLVVLARWSNQRVPPQLALLPDFHCTVEHGHHVGYDTVCTVLVLVFRSIFWTHCSKIEIKQQKWKSHLWITSKQLSPILIRDPLFLTNHEFIVSTIYLTSSSFQLYFLWQELAKAA